MMERTAAAVARYPWLFITSFLAFSVFMVVRSFNKLKKAEEAKPAAPPAPSAEEKLLAEIRDLMMAQA